MRPLYKKIIVAILRGLKILHLFSPKMVDELKLREEKSKISKIPRYTNGTFTHNKLNIKFTDSASFLFMYNEIFENQIYCFKANSDKPFIIDCGANIGVSAIYFKQLYPLSEILAFEPDKEIFKILEQNISLNNLGNIELINKGLWDNDSIITFISEGADAGRINDSTKENSNSHIEVVSLRPYLNRPVDLLKIDIEGAEYKVLKSCEDFLYKVKNIFIEYHSFIDQEQNLSEITQILKKVGFRIYISTPGLTSLNPFLKVNSYLGMDMQLNIHGIK
jgi:FkbM family methyltransferase